MSEPAPRLATDRTGGRATTRIPDTYGMSSAEAAQRLVHDGPNALPQPERSGWPRLLAEVMREPMLLLLAAAALLYLLLGEARDAAVLAISVVAVVAMTLYQSMRAERALRTLRELEAPAASVWRNGLLQRVPANALVVGDVVRIAEGERVPADGRLLDADDLQVDASLLTGESMPVALSVEASGTAAEVQAGTLVVRGLARAQITATGARTTLGRIGASLQAQQRSLRRCSARSVGWWPGSRRLASHPPWPWPGCITCSAATRWTRCSPASPWRWRTSPRNFRSCSPCSSRSVPGAWRGTRC